jgi:hypothetical protein
MTSKLQEKSPAPKENNQHFKIEIISLLFMFSIFALLYPDPDLRFPSAGPDPADQNLMQFHADPEPQR